MTARRGRGDGSIHQRKDGRWTAVVDMGWANGKRRRKTVYAKTRREAASKLAQMRADKHAHALIIDSPTVEQWMRYWRDEIAVERIRPSTMRAYESYIDRHIVPRLGKHRLDALEPAHVRRMYADMRKPCPEPDEAGRCPHKPSHGLAEASVRQVHAILSRALKIAEREGKVAVNVCAKLDPPSVKKNPRIPLTVLEARRVLAAAEGDPFESRWYAALWLGMRQGEVLGLSWRDVDLDQGTIYVHRALQRVKGKGLVFVEPKAANSVRVIPLPSMVLSRLTLDWARHLNAGGDRDALVWNNNGKPIDSAKDYKRWGALLAKAEVPYVALHAARNTAGSLLMAAGVPDKVISEILGNDVLVTQAHYLRGDPVQHRAAMLALEGYAGS